MRLFAAITVPPEATAEIEAAVAPLRPTWLGMSWADFGHWHLTLTFLGEVTATLVPELAAGLGSAAREHPAAVLSVRGAGAFPGPASGRVLWAGVHAQTGAGQAALAALAAAVADAARRAGAPPADEGRSYRPHLTLARCCEPLDVTPLVSTLAGFAGSAWTARRMQLLSSRPGRRPRYQALGTWPLLAEIPAVNHRSRIVPSVGGDASVPGVG